MSDQLKIDSRRAAYSAAAGPSSNELERSIKGLAVELKVANDMEASVKGEVITQATGSPYLKDQPYYEEKVLYNSPKETEWREVKTFEEVRKDALVFKNLRKLNII